MKCFMYLAAASTLVTAAEGQGYVCPPAPPPPAASPGGEGAAGTPSTPSAPPSSPAPGSPSPGSPAPSSPSSPPSSPPGDGPASSPGSGPSAPAPAPDRPQSGGGGGGAPAAGPAGPTAPASGGSSPEIDVVDRLHWSHWWYLESAAYLDLRASIQGPPAPDGRSIVLSAPRAPSRAVVARDVFPRLLELASTHRDDDVVASALVSLARLVDEPGDASERARRAMLASLTAANHVVAESAAIALGLLASPETVGDLLHLVRNDAEARVLVGRAIVPDRTRAFAAFGLGLAAHRSEDVATRQRIALALVECLESERFAHPDMPVALLSALGLTALPERPVVPAAELQEHESVLFVLSRATQLAYLESWLRPGRRDTANRFDTARAHACLAAARLASDARGALRCATVATLAEVAKDSSETIDVRAAALVALGECARAGEGDADRRARKLLIDALRDGQPLERRFALISAARAATRAGEGDEPFAGLDETRRVLLSELARGHSSDRAWIALALGVLEEGLTAQGEPTHGSTVDTLIEVSRRRRGADDSAALGLALSLAARDTSGAERAGEQILSELEEVSDPDMRSHLLVAAALLSHEEVAPILHRELESSAGRPVALWSAAIGLGLLGESISTRLADMLREARSTATQVAVASAIANAGSATAVAPLLALVDDPATTSSARAAAVDALGTLCDLERLPWRVPYAHALPYFAATPTLIMGGTGLLELPW